MKDDYVKALKQTVASGYKENNKPNPQLNDSDIYRKWREEQK